MSLKRQFLITVLLVFAASIFPGTVAHADDDAAYGVFFVTLAVPIRRRPVNRDRSSLLRFAI
jgi:hypothetical protein